MSTSNSSNTTYKKLVLDPKCLKPMSQVNDKLVYIDAIVALNQALKEPNITVSERNVLESFMKEVRKNRFLH